MSNFKFYLNKTFANGQRAIQLRTHIDKNLFVYQTGCSIIPDLWNKKDQNPITVKKTIKPYRSENAHIDIDLENIKTRLDNMVSSIKKEILAFRTNGEKVDFKVLKKNLDKLFKTVKKSTKTKSKTGPTTLNDFIEDHIRSIENGATYTVGKKIKKYSRSTIKLYKEWKTQYLAFQKSKKKVYDFDDIDMDFYYGYVDYFLKKNYSTNSIGKQVKTLKAILRKAYKKELHQNMTFDNEDFATYKEDVDSIYLTNADLALFYNMDLSDRPHLEKVRDVFLVGCWTALRYSDYKRIKPDHVVTKGNRKFIKFTTQKTTELVMIPLRPELESILEKYDNKLPKTYEQKVNRFIKEIAKELGLNEPTTIVKTKGGLTVEMTVPKYELIQTHTARRTGATLMYKAGIPILDICKITGHRKPESLLRYIKTSKEETAERLSTNDFFSGPKLKKVV